MVTSAPWFAWALLSACFAALTAIFAKVGVAGIDPDFATAFRTLLIAGLLVPAILLAGKWTNPFTLPGRSLLFLALSALATGASWLCYFRALQAGDASKVAPVDKLSLVLVAVFAFVFLGERPSWRDWGGIALVACGVLVLALRR
ncbi:MAG: EamA family transporter [Proteobacteria bacterium]|nr:EamA family transporter [Pseudomonadota bacterium]